MLDDKALLKRSVNVLNPFTPLPANDPAYVNCQEVRGDGDIIVELGNAIADASMPCIQPTQGIEAMAKAPNCCA
jgi:hypothetical protein